MRNLLILAIVLIGIIQIRPKLEGPDSVNYYAIARSLSFDRDLMFNNEFEAYECPMTVTPTYHIVEHHQIGASLIWMFIFNLFKITGLGDERILTAAINLNEYLLGILALIFIFKISIKFFDQRSTFLSILAVLLGTNLLAYITLLSGASHVSSIFFISSFLLFYFNTYKNRSRIDWLILGGLAGLMLMARGDTFLYFIFPALDLFRHIKDKKLKPALSGSLIFILGLLFTFSPQILFWKIIFGKIFRPYAEYYAFTGNKFLEVLFSCSRGFLFFSPLLGLCFFIGLYHLYKKEKILAYSSSLIFLGLLYGIGRARLGWWAGSSFGNRYFLIFMPLFILSVAACFKRFSLKSQIIIIVISSFWSFLLFCLFALNRELETYKDIVAVFNLEFFYEVLRSIYHQTKDWLPKHIFLKSIFLTFGFLVIILFRESFHYIKLSKIILKKISICLVSAVIIYIHLIFIKCYFNDKKVISALEKRGFYETAVFGEFDKADNAGAYLEYTLDAIKDHRIDLAIYAVKRAMCLYPPSQEQCFESLYNIYTDFPKDFKAEFLKKADAFDCLGLSLMFYEKGELANSRYYFKEALRLKPDIIEVIKDKKYQFFYSRLEKAPDFFSHTKD